MKTQRKPHPPEKPACINNSQMVKKNKAGNHPLPQTAKNGGERQQQQNQPPSKQTAQIQKQ